MGRVLYPGRFQPFHKGHLSVVEELMERFDEVVIVIGSAQEGFTCRNPFTASERIIMIDRVLRSRGFSRDRYWLIPVPDINKPLAWTSYVLAMAPPVEAVASGNPHTLYIYRWLGFPTIKLSLVEPNKYNGSRIRKLMCMGDSSWRDSVPREVLEFIDEIGGVERVREVCGRCMLI